MNLPGKQPTNSSLPYQRLLIKGSIEVLRALHVGSGQASLLTDAAIRRDRRGQPYIPGSSLAGLLRSIAEDFVPYLCSDADATIRWLFGRKRDDDSQREDIGASHLVVEDAYICEQLPADVEIRDYVGIDRRHAAARAHLQYDREVAPGNTKYEFELILEEPHTEEVRLLLAVLDFWSEYGLQIGARTTTGLGESRIVKNSLKFYTLDFKQHKLLKSFLLDGGTDAKHIPSLEIKRSDIENSIKDLKYPDPPQKDNEAFRSQHLFVTIDLILEEPLLVKGNIPEVPDLPEEEEDQGQISFQRTSDAEFITALKLNSMPEPYIPGSSLKGILRTRAEKIVRTLNFYRGYHSLAEAEANPLANINYEKRLAACAITHADDSNPRLQACFGNRKRQETAKGHPAEEIYDCSCLICRIFGNPMMRGRLTCTEATPVVSLIPKLFDHVAIDRFTGGAADAKKFDTRPLMPATNNVSPPQTVKAFTFKLYLERPELWMLGLLGHLLKDLNSGDIRIGHATRRGYGRVRGYVDEATLLTLPNTALTETCCQAELNIEEKFATYGPYREVNLTDWKRLFSDVPWNPLGPDVALRNTPGAKLLEMADEAFQEHVGKAEREKFGELHDATNDLDQ